MPKKSQRTAFIRVSEENNTNNGIVKYDDESIDKMVKTFSNANTGSEYFYIKHSADADVGLTHWHIVYRFKNPVPFDNIKNVFPYGCIENCKSVKQCVQYLVHQNDSSKKHYEWESVITNCKDITPYKLKSESQTEVDIHKIIERIEKGEIKEYNQFTEIPIGIWAKYKTRIENALLFYKERICMDKNRNITVVFASGDSGCGKTTWAKDFCTKMNKSFCISSSSNDAMQDYKGEDVLILDDLRDNSFTFTDLLKMLDNHTMSTVKSRYHNKAFIGDMIIITSFLPITEWYFNIDKESKIQLYRRIRVWYKFNNDCIEAFEYNEQKCKYELQGKLNNIYMMSTKQQANVALNMMKALGLELAPDVEQKAKDNWVNINEDSVKDIPKEWF